MTKGHGELDESPGHTLLCFGGWGEKVISTFSFLTRGYYMNMLNVLFSRSSANANRR